MTGYYVETWQPDGIKAEASANVESFDAAIVWLNGRQQKDPKRILRIRGMLSSEQEERLSAYGSVQKI